MKAVILGVTAAIFIGLAALGYITYVLTKPRPPMSEGDGDDE